MRRSPFHGHQFPPEIIRHAVWLYLRFTLSFRDVEDLLAERGIDVSYETIRRWVLKFGPIFVRELRSRRARPSSTWHLDEMVIRIGGERFWLWRAVDHEGEVLDMQVQRRRDTKAAQRLMRKLLRKQGFAPEVLVTDKLASYGCARRSSASPVGTPDWSPVRTFKGYGAWGERPRAAAEDVLAREAAATCGCANDCGVHGHAHATAWSAKLPISDLKANRCRPGDACFGGAALLLSRPGLD